MPHIQLKDRLNHSIYIIGVPGSGLQTLSEELGGTYTDRYGYRTTHTKPEEWLMSIPLLRYHMTNPEHDNPYFVGFCQNYKDVCELPFKRVILIAIEFDSLLERVSKYREDNGIVDGNTNEEVTRQLFSLQCELVNYIYGKFKYNPKKFRIISEDGDPFTIIDIIKRKHA